MAGLQPSILVSESIRSKAFALLFFLLFPGFFVSAQKVKITFEGNERTKSSFLLQVLGIDTLNFDQKELEKGIQRLRNLPILVNVEEEINRNTSPVEVVLNVEEGLVIWPLLSFGGVLGNRWFLIGASDFNLGGKAIQSTVFYRNIDREHNAFFSLDAPFIRGSSFGGGIEVQRYAAIEPLFFQAIGKGVSYRYENFTVGGNLTHLFDYQHRVKFGLSYLHEDYTALEEVDPLESFSFPQLASKDKYLVKMSHLLNRVNFHGFERAGWSFTQQFQLINDWGTFENPFLMYWMEGKLFQRLGAANLAVQGRLGISSNEMNPFAPFVLDSQLNIRGAGNRVDRGTATAVLNAEFRWTAFDSKLVAAQAVAFSDLGSWRNAGGELRDLLDEVNVQHFAGIGLRLIYKRSQLATLRVDYGINSRDPAQKGLVIGVGQFF